MWTNDLWQPSRNNEKSNIEGLVWAVTSIICVARWGVFSVKISVIFHKIKRFRRDMWSISSQDGCCTLTGCLFLALASQERRYDSPPWICGTRETIYQTRYQCAINPIMARPVRPVYPYYGSTWQNPAIMANCVVLNRFWWYPYIFTLFMEEFMKTRIHENSD